MKAKRAYIKKIKPEKTKFITSSEQFNNSLYSLRGISYCYHCKSKELIYDEIRDEIICKTCSTVLRQGLKDYESIIIKNSEQEDTTFREHLNKDYLDDLQIIQK